MSDSQLDALLGRVSRSSTRLRVAMCITAALCLLITAGIAADRSVWSGGWGWRVAGGVGVCFFAATAVLLLWAALRRQQRHIARLRRALSSEPQSIRSVRLLVARAVPVASWTPDDGSARTGLHIVVEDQAGRSWVLPVSRDDAADLLSELRLRCPQAATGPE